jgi:predicted RNase H-like HicB family nuclease
MKYAYAAIFTTEDDGAFSVHFPDLPGCHTCGDDLSDAANMAQDALCLWLYDMEQDKKQIPPASDPRYIEVGEDGFVSVVAIDTDTYRRFYENESVSKTLSIPQWLNERAEHENINFSGVLQEALKMHLRIQE